MTARARGRRIHAIIPPKPAQDGKIEQERMLEYLRDAVEAIRQDFLDQDDAEGFDHRNEIEVVSEGIGQEVRIPHQLGFVPARMSVVDPGDREDGVVVRSRPDLGDKDFIYVKTTAPRGTKFVILVKSKRS